MSGRAACACATLCIMYAQAEGLEELVSAIRTSLDTGMEARYQLYYKASKELTEIVSIVNSIHKSAPEAQNIKRAMTKRFMEVRIKVNKKMPEVLEYKHAQKERAKGMTLKDYASGQDSH